MFYECSTSIVLFSLFFYVLLPRRTRFLLTVVSCASMQCCNCDAREEPERWRKSWIFVLHGWAIVVGLSGLAFGFTYGLQMDTVFEFLFFYALFNLYVKSGCGVHVGGTRCGTSSTDNNTNRHAWITLKVDFIRVFLYFFFDGWRQWRGWSILTFFSDLIDFQVHSYVDVFVHPLELERRRHQHDGHGTIERHPRRRRGRSDGETRRSAWFSKHLNFDTNVCVQLEAVGRHLPVLQSCHVHAVCTPSRCVQKWKTQGSTPVRTSTPVPYLYLYL